MGRHVFRNKCAFIRKSQDRSHSIVASHDNKAFSAEIDDIETGNGTIFATERGCFINDSGCQRFGRMLAFDGIETGCDSICGCFIHRFRGHKTAQHNHQNEEKGKFQFHNFMILATPDQGKQPFCPEQKQKNQQIRFADYLLRRERL